jgi:hypothetical protein
MPKSRVALTARRQGSSLNEILRVSMRKEAPQWGERCCNAPRGKLRRTLSRSVRVKLSTPTSLVTATRHVQCYLHGVFSWLTRFDEQYWSYPIPPNSRPRHWNVPRPRLHESQVLPSLKKKSGLIDCLVYGLIHREYHQTIACHLCPQFGRPTTLLPITASPEAGCRDW